MNSFFIQFSGRITGGAGNNSCSVIYIATADKQTIGFGINHVPSLNINHQLYFLSPKIKKQARNLSANTWYDFRLEIDWSYVNDDNFIGLASFKYKESSDKLWLVDSSMENMELKFRDLPIFNRLDARLDGINSRRGELDDILISYGKNCFLSGCLHFLDKPLTKSNVM
ncbi:hypothetical protein MHK_005618, partial [Candidatus Magnetomorum sp. HK-1]